MNAKLAALSFLLLLTIPCCSTQQQQELLTDLCVGDPVDSFLQLSCVNAKHDYLFSDQTRGICYVVFMPDGITYHLRADAQDRVTTISTHDLRYTYDDGNNTFYIGSLYSDILSSGFAKPYSKHNETCVQLSKGVIALFLKDVDTLLQQDDTISSFTVPCIHIDAIKVYSEFYCRQSLRRD